MTEQTITLAIGDELVTITQTQIDAGWGKGDEVCERALRAHKAKLTRAANVAARAAAEAEEVEEAEAAEAEGEEK